MATIQPPHGSRPEATRTACTKWLIVGIFTHFSALMGVIMNLAFLFAGSTSTNPQMLVVGLAIVLIGGVAVGYYGLDYFAHPIEGKLFKQTRSRLFPQPQAA